MFETRAICPWEVLLLCSCSMLFHSSVQQPRQDKIKPRPGGMSSPEDVGDMMQNGVDDIFGGLQVMSPPELVRQTGSLIITDIACLEEFDDSDTVVEFTRYRYMIGSEEVSRADTLVDEWIDPSGSPAFVDMIRTQDMTSDGEEEDEYLTQSWPYPSYDDDN